MRGERGGEALERGVDQPAQARVQHRLRPGRCGRGARRLRAGRAWTARSVPRGPPRLTIRAASWRWGRGCRGVGGGGRAGGGPVGAGALVAVAQPVGRPPADRQAREVDHADREQGVPGRRSRARRRTGRRRSGSAAPIRGLTRTTTVLIEKVGIRLTIISATNTITRGVERPGARPARPRRRTPAAAG